MTIGRGADADWALDDPHQIMSRQHCVIERREGQYWVIDESRNGTFVNDRPIPPGEPHRLRDGDRLRLGDQVLTARLEGDEAATSAGSEATVTFDPDRVLDPAPDAPRAAPDDRAGGGPLGLDLDDGATPPAPRATRSSAEADDSLFGTDFDTPSSSGAEPAPSAGRPEKLLGTDFDVATPRSSPPDHEPSADDDDSLFGTDFDFDTPSSSPSEPAPSRSGGENLFGSEFEVVTPSSPPAAPAPRERGGEKLLGTDFAVERPPAKTRKARDWRSPEPAEIKPADGAVHHHSPLDDYFPPPEPRPSPPTAAPRRPKESDLMAAFLRGAKLDRRVLGDRDEAAMLREVGRCFRVAAEGLRDILASRAMVKGEAGMENTLPGAHQSNPLKHLSRGDDAARALLDPGAAGFLAPADAMAAGFKDIGIHEIALLAAMRALVHTVLGRLDPKTLEVEAGKDGNLKALAAGGRRALAFEALLRRHAELGREADDILRGELGRVFREAYQQQTRKL